MNKKAGVFAIGMVITLFILMRLTWHGFTLFNEKVDKGISSLDNLTTLYAASERISFYLQEASRLSASQAYYIIAQEAAIDKEKQKCFTRKYQGKDIIQWEELCKPQLALLKQKFLSEQNKSLIKFIERYPEKLNISMLNTIENDLLSTMIKVHLTTQQASSFALYNLSYGLEKNFKINLTEEKIFLDDFVNIYDKSSTTIKECKNQEIKTCLKKLSFKNWNYKVTVFDRWVLFEFSSKKYFFFENETGMRFEPIELKFSLAL